MLPFSASADLTYHCRPRKSRRPTERLRLFSVDLHNSHLSLASLFSLMTSSRLRAHEAHISLVPMKHRLSFWCGRFSDVEKERWLVTLPKPLPAPAIRVKRPPKPDPVSRWPPLYLTEPAVPSLLSCLRRQTSHSLGLARHCAEMPNDRSLQGRD
jgi:hypothetical protein